jgi:putative hydrolase of the HAD superfamily
MRISRAAIKGRIRRLTPIPTALNPTGEIQREIRCILFDVYGTLFISASGDISLARQNSPQLADIQSLLEKYQIQLSPGDLLDQLHAAIRHRHAELHDRGIDYPEVRIDHIWQGILSEPDFSRVRRFAAEFEYIVNPVYPMPGLSDLLQSVRNRSLPMGIISNAQFYTPLLFEWFLDADPVSLGFSSELIFYSYQFEMAKPSVALFEMAVDQLGHIGIGPEAVLYLGNDMLNDIYPAVSAGFQTALFAGDSRSLRLRPGDPRCRELKPDLVVTDLSQLIPRIGGQTVQD